MNTLIVTGGKTDKNFVKEHLNHNKYDIIIAVDKGLEIFDICGIKPQYIVGDFDSIDKNILIKYEKENLEIIRLNPEKDLTDTHSAIELAIKKGSTDITIIGAIGTRMDHTIANIHILKIALDKNIQIKIINENNEIRLINRDTEVYKDNRYKYLSLIPLTTKVEGVTLKGLKYLLDNATLYIGDSIGVSNEQFDDIAEIKMKNGILILIRSID